MTTPPVALHDVSVTLGGRPVLRQIDLTVRPGEFAVLLGSNGSGKSTLVRSCVRLLPLTTGDVELFGTSVGRFRDWQRIGYVPQRSTATSGVPSTVSEVVSTGRLGRRRHLGWPSRRDRRGVAEALDLVELSDRAREPVAQLSGGQQQRVMIARALAASVELLIMDEPTAGVDHHSQDVLAGVLRHMLATGTTVMMVAHELGPFAGMVDRAIVLRDGRVGYDGPVADISTPHGDPHHTHTSEPTAEPGVPADGAWP